MHHEDGVSLKLPFSAAPSCTIAARIDTKQQISQLRPRIRTTKTMLLLSAGIIRNERASAQFGLYLYLGLGLPASRLWTQKPSFSLHQHVFISSATIFSGGVDLTLLRFCFCCASSLLSRALGHLMMDGQTADSTEIASTLLLLGVVGEHKSRLLRQTFFDTLFPFRISTVHHHVSHASTIWSIRSRHLVGLWLDDLEGWRMVLWLA